jgi:hypothetical protein
VRTLNRPVGAEAHRLGTRARVSDHIDQRRLAGLDGGLGAFQGGANVVWLLDVLAVTAKHLGELVVDLRGAILNGSGSICNTLSGCLGA